jgi:uncharacterized protein (TIGR02118 family)
MSPTKLQLSRPRKTTDVRLLSQQAGSCIHGPLRGTVEIEAKPSIICFVSSMRREENLMIKMTIFYPNEEGKKFDMDYYVNSHIPMVMEKLGGAVKGGNVDQGLAGGEPGSPAIYVAMGHLLFDSVEEFQSAFGPHMEAIMADIPNYTDIQPKIQVSEVKI